MSCRGCGCPNDHVKQYYAHEPKVLSMNEGFLRPKPDTKSRAGRVIYEQGLTGVKFLRWIFWGWAIPKAVTTLTFITARFEVTCGRCSVLFFWLSLFIHVSWKLVRSLNHFNVPGWVLWSVDVDNGMWGKSALPALEIERNQI